MATDTYDRAYAYIADYLHRAGIAAGQDNRWYSRDPLTGGWRNDRHPGRRQAALEDLYDQIRDLSPQPVPNLVLRRLITTQGQYDILRRCLRYMRLMPRTAAFPGDPVPLYVPDPPAGADTWAAAVALGLAAWNELPYPEPYAPEPRPDDPWARASLRPSGQDPTVPAS